MQELHHRNIDLVETSPRRMLSQNKKSCRHVSWWGKGIASLDRLFRPGNHGFKNHVAKLISKILFPFTTGTGSVVRLCTSGAGNGDGIQLGFLGCISSSE